ncbi:two-component system regulatory protein YycI [Halobacillus litoralis]|uniref:two-component system regulatory protein YycI n=1 Tax=Halobacillus litoralis TaxID=45668 RepID=UPI001CD58F6C|nr:two-component system regulatory protein YycI [Halobacillus litoralis]MCA0972286.1 two-component system regulatory protein YycI [Halobacillus litoralis]
MQWGQIKTLFIISFLILDLFLLNQFLNKQYQSQVNQLTIESEEMIDQLEEGGVTFAEGILDEETQPLARMSSRGAEFSDSVLGQIETLDEGEAQQIQMLQNEGVVKSELEEPVEVTEDTMIEEVGQIVPFSDQYSYWGYNQDEGIALFFQKASDRTVYFNQGGMLMVRVEDGAITEYVATLLSFANEEEATNEPIQLISKVTIVNQLFENGYIQSGDEVTSMQVGYYNALIATENIGPQLFEPTWKVVVNGTESFFAFATSGRIIEISEEDFIQDSIRAFDFTQDLELETENNDEE